MEIPPMNLEQQHGNPTTETVIEQLEILERAAYIDYTNACEEADNAQCRRSLTRRTWQQILSKLEVIRMEHEWQQLNKRFIEKPPIQ
jgi:hypothetical protein